MNSTILTAPDGTITFTYCDGDGPPVVMLHGMVSTGDSWAYTYEALKASHRVIAPDLPGHGRSGGGAKPYGLSFYVEWLAGFLDALQIPDVILVGQSMGGAISTAFTLRYPKRVNMLILVDALGMSSKIPWHGIRNIAWSIPHYVRSTLTRRDDPHLFRFFQPWGFLDPWGPPRAIIEQMAALNKPRELSITWAGTRLLLGDFRSQRKRDAFVDKLAQIDTPTLVIWGRHDGLLLLENAREGIARIPNVTLEVLEESAHEPMLEQPDEFNRLVRAFLGGSA